MKYVVLDLEACNGFKRDSVCNIAMLVLGEQLNVEKEYNLIINPQASFRLPSELDIGFRASDFVGKPTFPSYYGLLKKYLSGEYLVIGHSVYNDILMLSAMTNRYHLPKLVFPFLCTQVMFLAHLREPESRCSLSTMAEHFGVSFINHHAIEDTKATLLAVKKMLDAEKCTLLEFIEKYHINLGQIHANSVTLCTSAITESQKINRRIANGKYHLTSKKTTDSLLNIYHHHFAEAITEEKKIFRHLTFTFNTSLEQSDKFEDLVLAIILLGGSYSMDIHDANIFIRGRGVDRRLSGLNKEITIWSESHLKSKINDYRKLARETFETFLSYSTQ